MQQQELFKQIKFRIEKRKKNTTIFFLSFLLKGEFLMELFNQLINHTSVRDFEKKAIPEALKAKLIKAAQSGSSSNFVQAYSIIEIKDMKKLTEISQIAKGQKSVTNSGTFYIFVADLYRNYQIAKQVNQDLSSFSSIESLIVATVDATIAAQSLAIFAESQELGICYIGGIRNNLFKIAELLDLPPYTVPLFGLTVGYPQQKNEVKPRLPETEILKIDSYQAMSEAELQAYNSQMSQYYQERTTNHQESTWSKKVQQHFEKNRRPDVLDFLEKQGFTF